MIRQFLFKEKAPAARRGCFPHLIPVTNYKIRDTILINQKFDYLYAENISKKGQVMGVKEYKFAGDDRHLLNEYHRQLDSLGEWQINFTPAKNQTYAFDQIGSGTPVSGYMPRGYNAGFIYDGGSPHTIAHELGHGIAGLEHVFENSNNSGKTKNLMDCSFEKDAIITIFFDILSNAPSQLTKQEKLFFVAQNKQYILDKLKNVAIDKSKMFEAYNTLDVKKVDWNLEFVSYILGLNF